MHCTGGCYIMQQYMNILFVLLVAYQIKIQYMYINNLHLREKRHVVHAHILIGAGLRGGAGPRTGSGPGRMQGRGRSQGLGRDRTEAELEGEKWRRRSRETARAKRKMGSVAEAGGGAEGCFSSCVEEHHHTPSRLFLLALWFDFYRRPMSRPSFSQAGSL